MKKCKKCGISDVYSIRAHYCMDCRRVVNREIQANSRVKPIAQAVRADMGDVCIHCDLLQDDLGIDVVIEHIRHKFGTMLAGNDIRAILRELMLSGLRDDEIIGRVKATLRAIREDGSFNQG